jgi:hypothetical protein
VLEGCSACKGDAQRCPSRQACQQPEPRRVHVPVQLSGPWRRRPGFIGRALRRLFPFFFNR